MNYTNSGKNVRPRGKKYLKFNGKQCMHWHFSKKSLINSNLCRVVAAEDFLRNINSRRLNNIRFCSAMKRRKASRWEEPG
jgi:hypothetical protein